MNSAQIAWVRSRFAFESYEKMPVYGSRRSFYRLKRGNESLIAITDDNHEQFNSYLNCRRIFQKLNVNVPFIFDFFEDLDIILAEDLGEDLLEDIINASENKWNYYKKVIDALIEWQQNYDEYPNVSGSVMLPEYTVEFARNDTRLFTARYLKGYLDLAESEYKDLYPRFDELAESAAAITKTLMHRDFQTRNMLWRYDEPHFVDFQAAMIGPYTYDIASLVFDNHVDLERDLKEKMIDYFFSFYPEQDRSDLYPAAVQRTLQAIGTYAFLSRERGSTRYERFIPVGLRHLEEIGTMSGDERMRRLIAKLLNC